MIQNRGLITVLSMLAWGSALGQLSPTGSDIEKVACKDITPAQNFSLNFGLLSIPGVFIVPMASISNVRVYAATFLGRLAKDQAEVDQMCMNILQTGLVATQTGYVNRTYINLAIPTELQRGPGIFNFSTQVTHTPGVNTSYQATSIETVPLGDGKDYAMFVRCINNDFMDWKIASKRPLTSGEKAGVLNKARELGFGPTKYYDRDNAASGFNCPAPPTVPEAAAQTLINFRVLSKDSPLVRNLGQPLQILGKGYNNLVTYFNTLIVTPIVNFGNLFIQNCTGSGVIGQPPLGCRLLSGNANLRGRF